jgi:hypothetical protein
MKRHHRGLAEQCGNSVAMIERHYGRFLSGEAEAQLRLLEGISNSRRHRGESRAALKTVDPHGKVDGSAEIPLAEEGGPNGNRTRPAERRRTLRNAR